MTLPGPLTPPSQQTAPNTPTAPVTVEIDALVVVGFEQANAAGLASAIREALTQALITQGPPRWWKHATTAEAARHLPSLQVPIRAGDSPATIAHTLAAQLCAPLEHAPAGEP